MSADVVNEKYTDQNSKKEVLGDELEGYVYQEKQYIDINNN